MIFSISRPNADIVDVILQNAIILIHQDKVDPWIQALYFFYGLGVFFGTSLESLIYLDAYFVFFSNVINYSYFRIFYRIPSNFEFNKRKF